MLSRFGARYREYKYFMTQDSERCQPCDSPTRHPMLHTGCRVGTHAVLATMLYIAPRRCRPLDIPAMQQAASYLVGEHDFRNFCKMDVEHVLTFRCLNYTVST